MIVRIETGQFGRPGPVRRGLYCGILAQPLIAFGRTQSGMPFGAEGGQLTDLFFLICSVDDASHLRTLARLSRLIGSPGFLEALRFSDTPHDLLAEVGRLEVLLPD